MRLKRYSIFFAVFIVFVFILFFPNLVWSASYTTECGETFSIGECWSPCCEWECVEWDEKGNCTGRECVESCTQCRCRGSWVEYKADTAGCQPKILKRECRSVCGSETDCCRCGPCQAECDPWEGKIIKECESWQEAKRKRGCEVTKWGLRKLKCKCEGDCIQAPENPRYYDNPTYSDIDCKAEPEKCKEGNNIFLPVKLDWDDVPGWKGGWKENGEEKTCPKEKECVNSYRIRIAATTDLTLKDPILEKSEYNPRQDNGSCFLKSGTVYNWHVKGCCNDDGTNCGPESNWQFTTNWAPEPISPEDPDWNGPDTVKDISIEDITLKWCESDYKHPGAEGPMAYKLFFCQKNDLGKDDLKEDVCHPLERRNVSCSLAECPYYLLRPEVGARSPYPLPEFSNKEHAYFTKEQSYSWRVSACKDRPGNVCTDFGQKWRFDIIGTLEPPTSLYPSDPNYEKPFGLPVTFRWLLGSPGSFSFSYEIYKEGVKIYEGTTTLVPNFTLDYSTLSPQTKYDWRVKPCWDMEAKKCEDAWSEATFWTTGRPPKEESLRAEKLTDIFIPVNFKWEEVPGAKSYRIKILGDGLSLEKPVGEAKFFLDYPDLKQEATYSWQVKTCARENGQLCGEWSVSKSFTTLKLALPSNPSPENNKEIFTYQIPMRFSWDPVSGANYYQYVITYTAKSPKEVGQCPTGEIINKIVSTNNSGLISLNCLGKYKWEVRACLAANCEKESAGGWSSTWHFSLKEEGVPEKGGLVPCGRIYDNPKTPWNERDPCQIKHLFFLLADIIGFLLWQLGVIILVILVVVTGVIYYFSLGSPATVVNVKSIWRSAGIGYGIIFLAWAIISLFLSILGYHFEFFGRWWQIHF